MKRVNVAKFKAELSKYLHYVRRGGQVIVLDRVTPIAKVAPWSEQNDAALEIEAASDEALTFFDIELPPVKGKKTDSLNYLLEERGER